MVVRLRNEPAKIKLREVPISRDSCEVIADLVNSIKEPSESISDGKFHSAQELLFLDISESHDEVAMLDLIIEEFHSVSDCESDSIDLLSDTELFDRLIGQCDEEIKDFYGSLVPPAIVPALQPINLLELLPPSDSDGSADDNLSSCERPYQ